jgi:hypothetical protein
MDAERLSLVVRAAKAEIEGAQLVERLDNLLNSMNQRIHRPSEQSQHQLSDELRQLDAALNDSNFAQLPRTSRSTLEEVGAYDLLGHRLRENICSIIQKHTFTLADARQEIQHIKDRIVRYQHAFTKVTEGFDILGIKETKPEPGEAELGILMPRRAFHNELKRFADEVQVIDRAIRFFNELITGSHEAPQIKQLSTTDPVVGVSASIPVAVGVLGVVDSILGIIKSTDKVRAIKTEAVTADVSKNIITMLEGEAKKKIEVGLIDIETRLFQQYPVQGNRAQELKTEGKKVLRDLAARVDNGYQIDGEAGEIDAGQGQDGQTPDPERQAKIEGARRVNELARRIRNAELPKEPVLRLPGPEGEDASEPAEKKHEALALASVADRKA